MHGATPTILSRAVGVPAPQSRQERAAAMSAGRAVDAAASTRRRRDAPGRLGSYDACHRPLEYFPSAVDIRLHFGQRDAERGGDLLVAHVLEMKEHEWHALMIGKCGHRVLQRFLP